MKNWQNKSIKNNKSTKRLIIYNASNCGSIYATSNGVTTNVNNKHNFTKEVTRDNHKLYADYALSVQLQTQEVVGNLIEKYIKKTDTKNVCITGGYGFNVVCNQYLTDRFPDLEFYFEPLADDSGNSIGAANYVCRKATEISDIIPLTHTFFNQ